MRLDICKGGVDTESVSYVYEIRIFEKGVIEVRYNRLGEYREKIFRKGIDYDEVYIYNE